MRSRPSNLGSRSVASHSAPGGDGLPTRAAVIGVLNERAQPGDCIVAAAGAPPGDLLKSWDASGGRRAHIEFGYSCMGYEIPAGLGARLARSGGEVLVLVGDGTYLMNPTELVTAAQEGWKITVVVLDNHGFQVIRRLQMNRVGHSFGNELRTREGGPLDLGGGGASPAATEVPGRLEGPPVALDLAATARGFGVSAASVRDLDGLRRALDEARRSPTTTVVVVEVAPYEELPDSGAWWDVAPAEVSSAPETRALRAEYDTARSAQLLPMTDSGHDGGGRLGVALLGAGRIGTLHGRNLARLAEAFRVVGVADPDLAAGRALAGQLSALAYGSWEELVAADGVEAVLVCSATAMHAPQVAFAAAGRHVFCEKPLAEDLAGVDLAIAAARAAGVVLQVGFNRRFDAGFAGLAEAVASGELGRLVQLRLTSRDPEPPPPAYPRGPGGLFTDMTIHDFDLLRFLSGDEVVSLSAFAESPVDPAAAAAGDVDVAVVVATLASGGFAVIENCRRSSYGYDQRAEAHGTGRTAWAANPLPNQLMLADGSGARGPAVPLLPRALPGGQRRRALRLRRRVRPHRGERRRARRGDGRGRQGGPVARARRPALARVGRAAGQAGRGRAGGGGAGALAGRSRGVTIAIGNAHTSWGIKRPSDPAYPAWETVLDKVALSGYAGVELGPLGFSPLTRPSSLPRSRRGTCGAPRACSWRSSTTRRPPMRSSRRRGASPRSSRRSAARASSPSRAGPPNGWRPPGGPPPPSASPSEHSRSSATPSTPSPRPPPATAYASHSTPTQALRWSSRTRSSDSSSRRTRPRRALRGHRPRRVRPERPDRDAGPLREPREPRPPEGRRPGGAGGDRPGGPRLLGRLRPRRLLPARAGHGGLRRRRGRAGARRRRRLGDGGAGREPDGRLSTARGRTRVPGAPPGGQARRLRH